MKERAASAGVALVEMAFGPVIIVGLGLAMLWGMARLLLRRRTR